MTEETAREAPAGVSGPDKGAPEEGAQPRGKWANKIEYMLCMAGEIVGVGNIWRFPYLCFKNGGGAFFIPYFVFLLFCGIPVLFLETAVGQYTSEGGVTAWRKICPMFEGVGIASHLITALVNIYSIVVLAWTIIYMYYSFQSPLPWSTCDNWWNTELCHSRPSFFANPHLFQPGSNWSFLHNVTSLDFYDDLSSTSDPDPSLMQMTPEREFWTHRMLRMAHDMSLGTVNWDLAVCLLLAWIICYFCNFKGIKSAGKAVYFTATVPYLMLIILFFRGVTLPGAGEGLRYYLEPDFTRLAHPGVWEDAAIQVFFSLAMCQGVMTAMGSYNKYNNNCYRDCLVLCGLNMTTSIFAGFIVFSVLGFMAYDMNVPIDEVAASGPALVFLAYPRALSLLPGASFWTLLFFLITFLLALDSQFVCVETLATAITDMFPRQLRSRRAILVLVIAVVCFLLGLPLITEGGIYLFTLMDNYGAGATSLLFIGCFETIIIAWVYGADRFYDNIEDMIGYPPFPVLKYCWLFITPLLTGVTLLYNLSFSHIFLPDGYEHGIWGRTLGALFVIIPLMCIPVFLLIRLFKSPENMTTPSSDLRQARPHKPILTLCNHVIFKAQAKPNRHVDDNNEKMVMGEPSMV